MIISKYTGFILLIFIVFCNTLISCNKSEKINKNSNHSLQNPPIPSYSGINFQSIFTESDNYSADDNRIKVILNKYYKDVWETAKLSGGILVARGNNILLEKYSGYSNYDLKTPITATTPMHVASISKILTSLVILKLVEVGEINFDQKVNTILKNFPYSELTIQDLLTHRSGLPNYAYLTDKNTDRTTLLSNQDILNLFSNTQPELLFKRDTQFLYSNTNFVLLALIAEKITNTSFPSLVNYMIFKPLGMDHSYILQEKYVPYSTLSYYANGKPYNFEYLDLIYGDKNLYTTPDDLFRLSKAMFAPNFLPKNLLEKMFTPYSNEKKGIKNYGLGMRLMVFENGKKIVYHTGWWHGSNAIFIHLLDEKVTIIAIGNKYSRAIYSAINLTALFGDYPLNMEDLH
ncbi:class A beta-lactamase-related serine hydrolase [Apibacter muscae]|uniref:serine hydrolase domain-containing protein n=1 Tax=Apibacter muscae TaxID=2509004 RepID=UPI0011AC6B73|nr:serine hydrolase domain-containing protein [Apibacter muscae]TWP22902.1 class A beta-lactamase-related serine hydrolase [Apibacter muscae]